MRIPFHKKKISSKHENTLHTKLRTKTSPNNPYLLIIRISWIAKKHTKRNNKELDPTAYLLISLRPKIYCHTIRNIMRQAKSLHRFFIFFARWKMKNDELQAYRGSIATAKNLRQSTKNLTTPSTWGQPPQKTYKWRNLLIDCQPWYSPKNI